MQAEPEILQAPTFSDQQRLARIKKKPQILTLNDIYQIDGSQCGYCHKKDGSLQWSFSKKKMECYTYELLMERGWRRCGTYYYKPNLQKSCCKLFTHRLEVARFKPKKDQKKALKKVIALAYQKVQQMQIQEKQIHNKNDNKKQQNSKKTNQKAPILQIQQATKQRLLKVCEKINNSLKNTLFGLLSNSGLPEQKYAQYTFDVVNKIKFFVSKPGENSDYYCNYIMLLFGINKKLFGNPKYSLIDFSKDVKDFVEKLGVIQNYRSTVQRGGYLLFKKQAAEKSNSFEILDEKQQKYAQLQNSQKIQKKGQQAGLSKIVETIKNKLKSGLNPKNQQNQSEMLQQKKPSNNFQILQPNLKFKGELDISYNKITFGKITIQIVPAEESVHSFKLYQQYTAKIHEKKEKKLSSYVDFLCLQALQFRKQVSKVNNQAKQLYIPSWDPTSKHQKPKAVTGEVQKLMGCYHMKYFFEGNLLAVGVVDIVDDGLSSVYFFYDPKFKECRLGVFSSLIEIQYVRWMRLSFPQFRYYYMGFYISNSQKMNYKVDYMPCQLLCPITYWFVQFTNQIKVKTDRIAKHEQKDIRLAKKQEQIIEDMHFKNDLGPFIDKNLKLIYDGRPLVLKQINPHFFVHILKILQSNVPVFGKKVFQLLTFAL